MPADQHLLILGLAANTAFSGFPRLAALLAQDRYLPRQMAWLGDRLVFQNGIGLLLLVSALVIVVCRGNTNASNFYALGVLWPSPSPRRVWCGLVQACAGWRGRLAMNLGRSRPVWSLRDRPEQIDEGAWIVVCCCRSWSTGRDRPRPTGLHASKCSPGRTSR